MLPQIAGVLPSVRHLSAGTTLFRQGDKAFAIFRLLSGRITLNRVTPAGTEVAMHTARPGELFAEASIFSTNYHCDAVAVRDSEVLVYPKAELTRQLKGNPEELWAFSTELAHRVQGLRTRLEMRQIRSAPERVLQTLRLRCDATGAWQMDGTLKQFAEEVGLTHEALYRALATLERDRRISRKGQEIKVLDKE
jgi:CRP-like cAMP-binding protein